jgi:hypothetical protein|nr:VCBS repeat-containing protein [Kofleriaceae bacterium]
MRAALLALLAAAGCARLVGIEGFTPAGDGGGGDGSSGGPLAPPATRSPWNGVYTGAVGASTALRPEFRYAAVPGATHYELALDRTCDVASMQTCPFANALTLTSTTTSVRPTDPLPVTTARPVGSRYFWRVRACDDADCGAWSDVRYLNVGRLLDDTDGDGYSDVVVGSLKLNAAFYYQGSPAGLPVGSPPDTIPTPTDQFGLGNTFSFFADTLVAGDFDGDGFADVAVWGADSSGIDGDIFVLEGSTTGLQSTSVPQLTDPTSNQDSFGSRMFSPGDLNGDGFDDLVVNNNDQLDLYLGGPAGLRSPPMAITVPSLTGGHQSNNGIGDVDGDGFADFAIADGSNQHLLVFTGAAGDTAGATQIAQLAVAGTSEFGFVVTGGLLDGDELSDLVVFGQDGSGNGLAYGFHGTPGGVAATPYQTTVGPTGFGGCAEVVTDDTTPYVIAGAQDRVVELDGTLAIQGTFQDGTADARFGENIGACDCNGDGHPDLLLAGPEAQPTGGKAGIVYVHYGMAAAVSDQLWVSTSANLPEFGQALTQ